MWEVLGGQVWTGSSWMEGWRAGPIPLDCIGSQLPHTWDTEERRDTLPETHQLEWREGQDRQEGLGPTLKIGLAGPNWP